MLDIRFLVDRFCFLQPSEYVITSSSDLHCFWWEINCLSYCGCLVRGELCFSVTSKLCLFLAFSVFVLWCVVMQRSFSAYPTWVVLNFLEVYENIFLQIWEVFSQYFLNMFFCSILFLFSFWYYNLMHMLVWLMVFYISLRQSSVFFLILVFVSFLNCIISISFSVFKTSDFFLM